MQNKNIFLIAVAVAFILLLILLAMQITGGGNWSMFDFAAAGALLFGTGLAYELVARRAGSIAYRAGVGAALAAALLLTWVNLAVGILGSEDNPANLMYFGVLAVLVIGALIARFRPQGMARALFATALAQVLVAVIALVAQRDLPVFETLMITAFFAAMWVGSGLLFRSVNEPINQEASKQA
jgi:hypothetical protein